MSSLTLKDLRMPEQLLKIIILRVIFSNKQGQNFWDFFIHGCFVAIFRTYFRLLSREKDGAELKNPFCFAKYLLGPEALSPKANMKSFNLLQYSQFRMLHFSYSTQIMHILLLPVSHCVFVERNVYLSRTSSINPVSPIIQKQILQANLHTLP